MWESNYISDVTSKYISASLQLAQHLITKLLHISLIFQYLTSNISQYAIRNVQKHSGAMGELLYGFAPVRAIIHELYSSWIIFVYITFA